MRRELHYFDIYPKIVEAGEPTDITIQVLERGFRIESGKEYKVEIIPMLESVENVAGGFYTSIQAVAQGNRLVFSHVFPKEQEYAVRLYTEPDKFIRLSVYVLESDLFGLRPLMGDLHVHSNYSDGWESPEIVAAYYRKAGFDFMVISDHYNYEGSVAAKSFYEHVKIDLCIVNGEEVHAPDNHIHIVNFGGETSINQMIRDNEAQYRREVGDMAEGLSVPADVSAFEYASCLWVYDKIRKSNGLSIYAHPHWICDGYHVRDSMTKCQFQNRAFDAFELLGGMTHQENNMQLAFYYTAKAAGWGAFPIVGSSDSHGAVREPFVGSSYAAYDPNAFGFNEFKTIVFASANEKDSIIEAIKAERSVAVDSYKGETPQAYGEYRFVSYALFLLSEYFPLQHDLCYEEGRLMKMLASEQDSDAKNQLERLSGRTQALWERYALKKL